MTPPRTPAPPAQPARRFTRLSKYQVVANLLRDEPGTLLDVGARDRVLGGLLAAPGLRYLSADLGPGHDYALDLEAPLPLAAASFDFVVALDVLEHVEQIQLAFRELARIARRGVVLSLPNLASWPRRWSFLWHGHLGTGKYDLLPEHQGDRHRWLTVYPEINRFVAVNAAAAGWEWRALIEEVEGWPARGPALPVAQASGLLAHGRFTARCVYWLTRAEAPHV